MAFDFAFLDSGTGGIPYMLALMEKMPDARCVYLGDTAHFPYGEKTPEQVTSCAAKAVRLIQKNWRPRTLVIACNTISVTSLSDLRALFPSLPIVGTVPAIKLAAKVTRNKRIGLLATNATVRHPYNKKLIEDFASECKVFSRGDPELISFIEHDLFTADERARINAVRPSVDFFAENGCDTIILGCTHFTHIAEDIQKAAGKGVAVVDSREGVAAQALRVELGGHESLALSESGGGGEAGEEEKEMGRTGRPSKTSRVSNCSFFLTAADEIQEREYRLMCSRFKIPFGGKVAVDSDVD